MVWLLQLFISENVYLILIIIGVMIVCFFFFGFDVVIIFLEEILDVVCVILKVIFLMVVYGGVIFIVVLFFMQLFFFDISCFKDLDVVLFEIVFYVGGKLFQLIFFCIMFVNMLVFGLVLYVSVLCLLYVMGCDNVFLECVFGYVYLKWWILVLNVIMVGIVVMLVLFFDLVIVIVLINFGVLVVFIFVNLLVFNYFWWCKGMNKSWKEYFYYLLMLLVGVLMVGVLWINFEVILLMLGLVWVLLGGVYLWYLICCYCKVLLYEGDRTLVSEM